MIWLEQPGPAVGKSILEWRTGVAGLALDHNPTPSCWVSYPHRVPAYFPEMTGRTELNSDTLHHCPPGLRQT